MELKIIIRKSWKLLICTLFLTVALLLALLFSMQYILDGISVDYTLETYAYVGTIYENKANAVPDEDNYLVASDDILPVVGVVYRNGGKHAVYTPIREEALLLLREADTVQNEDVRHTVSARIPGTESVPSQFWIEQTNHLAFFRGAVKGYVLEPVEGTPYDMGLATVEVKSVYGGKSNWITQGKDFFVAIVGAGPDCNVRLDEEYYFITQYGNSDRLERLDKFVWAINYPDEVLAKHEELQKNSELYQNPVISVPEGMTGEEADAYGAELLAERGLDIYIEEIKNLDDIYTIRTTQDMQMLLSVANETMFFPSGRGIRPGDAGKKVCVISQELAMLHDFQVGDSIPLAMGDGGYEQDGFESGYPSFGEFSTVTYGEPQEYEIVGTYAFTTNDVWDASLLFGYNDIFVPENENPEAGAKMVTPHSFSFRVSGEQYDGFMESTAMELQDMGYTVQMVTSRWEEVEPAYQAMLQRRTLTLVWAVLSFILGTAVYVLLLIFLYKREYALRNLFGAKFTHTSRAYLTPFAVSAVLAGVLAVAAADWLYMTKLAPQAELTAPGRIPGNGQILPVLAVMVLVWLVLIGILILASAGRAKRKSVLKLLK